jgi:glutathione S-transferase
MQLLKFAGLPYAERRHGYARAPKGKLPYIDDAGVIVADSTFIRFHIENKYGFDFDAGLAPEEKAAGDRKNVRGTPLSGFDGDTLA